MLSGKSLREKRLYLRLGFHAAVMAFFFIFILAGALTDNASSSGFFAILLIGYLATLRLNPLPRLLERRLFKEIECAACGQTIQLMDSWSCGCGFVTWEPRHALSPCPVCKKEFPWLQCPSCENGIQT
jgi:hypothetical protein